MNAREIVRRTIEFTKPNALARSHPAPWGSHFARTGMNPSPDLRPPQGPDEWGAVWENVGICKMGEVVEPALAEWSDWDQLTIPDIAAPHRWESIVGAREQAGDKFLIGGGISLYERAHFVRGLQNLWMDIRLEPDNLARLLDILVDQNLYAIERYAQAGFDGYMFCDDWGLQDKLMIAPEDWKHFWKPRYAKVYAAAREAGLFTLLHSCGHIVSILDDLIEIGLQVIQMDQQQNMGLDLLGERFGGRITFWNPVDIQNTMAHGSLDEIRAYCRKMVRTLGRPNGGFIAGYYGDPTGAGHTPEAIEAMCDEFARIEREWYGKNSENWGA